MALFKKGEDSAKKKGISGSWGILLTAMIIAAGAFYFSYVYLTNKEASLREQLLGALAVEKKDVVVAITDLSPGDDVNQSNMAVASLPSEHVSKYAVTPDQFEQYQGHVLEKPMSKGEPLLVHTLEGLLIERFSQLLASGNRAVTLGIDEIASDAYMLTAGDYVDIFIMMDVKKVAGLSTGGKKEKVITPLLNRVKIIAIGPDSLKSKEHSFIHKTSNEDEEEDESYDTVSLEVSIKQAAILEMARVSGKFVLMLRNSEDTQKKNIRAINQSVLTALGLDTGDSEFYQYYSANRVVNGSIVPFQNQIGLVALQAGWEKEIIKSIKQSGKDESVKQTSVQKSPVSGTEPET